MDLIISYIGGASNGGASGGPPDGADGGEGRGGGPPITITSTLNSIQFHSNSMMRIIT